ncbi:MAG: carboxypeptidase regulatory-like domain-containing protein [Nitrospirae bacterium]|nr:carboxypeptidase regulatory-like domain-containing protein [Nitrospirota bacterium]
MSRLVLVSALLLALVVPAFAYDQVDVAGGGSISGTVTLTGKAPAAKKSPVTKDQEVCGKERILQAVVASPTSGLQNAVVRITKIEKGKRFAASPVTMDQKGCDYTPHIILLPKGKDLEILNSDGILHNVHTYGTKNPSFNKAMPKFKKQLTVPGSGFSEAENIEVRCDAHEWMHAWLQVIEHPYYSLTDAAGKFSLADVPPGTYTVEVWHEKLGQATKDVTVTGGKASSADFSLAAK